MDYNKYYKKTKIERDHNIDIREATSIDKAIYILLLTAIVSIPLFIKAHLGEFISPNLTFLSTGTQADIFSYYKYIFIIIVTILISILFIYKVLFLQYNISKSKINLFLGILAVIITLSAIFSPYKSVALHGMFNRHEGTITFICYLVLFFVAANTKYTVKQLQGFLYCLYPFVIINMILGLAIFQGKDLLEVGWINKSILGSVPEGAQVSEGAKLWATVSNPNYISGIGAVLSILFLTWAVFDKNKIKSAINVVISVLSFSMVLTSFSASGFLTVIVMIPIIIVLTLFNRQKVKSIVILMAFAVLVTSIYTPMAQRNPRVWDESFGFFIEENPFKEPQVSLFKPDSNILEKELRESFLPGRALAEENGMNSQNKFEIPVLPESGISAGSGRAYIWEKSWDTAMKNPIFGYGLDTFNYAFPQDDIEKVAGLRTYNIIVDKPHNMYLGLLVGSGFIALLAFILLVGSVLLKGITMIFRGQTPMQEKAVVLTLFTASFAYLIQGLVNDSVIGSAVIFWVVLGVFVSLIDNRDVA